MRFAVALAVVAACSSPPPAESPRAASSCDDATAALAAADADRAGGYLLRAREAAAAVVARCPAADTGGLVAAIDRELALPPAGTPSADDYRKAALLYRDAVRLRLQGKHAEAIHRLEQSFALSPHPFTLLQMAEAHAALGDAVAARLDNARALHLAESRAGARVEPLLASGHGGAISSVALSPDGRTLYSGASDGMVIAWDMSSGRERWRTPLRRLHKVFGITVSPDGTRLAAVCDDRVHWVDATTGAPRGWLRQGDGRASFTLFLDDERVAIGMADGTIEIWRGDQRTATLPAPERTPVVDMVMTGDRSRLVVGWINGHVATYDAHSLARAWEKATDSPVRAVAVSADAERVYAGLWNSNVAVFDGTGAELESFVGHPDGVYDLALFDDGRKLAVAVHAAPLRVFDLATRTVIHEIPQRSSALAIASLASGELAAVGDGAGELSAVNLMTGTRLRPMTRGGTDPFGVLIRSDGEQLATRLNDGSLWLWSLTTGAPIHLRADDHQMWSAAYSADGARIATVSQQGEVIVWRSSDGKQLARFGKGNLELLCAAWSSDGRRLYTGDEGGQVAIWDPAAGRELARFKVHEKWIVSIAVSPDQRTLATGSLDRTAALVDVASHQVRHRLKHYGEVHRALFTPDGDQLVSAGFGGNIRVWNVATGTLVRELATKTSFKDLALSGGIAYAAGADRRVHAMRIADAHELPSYGFHDTMLLSVAVHPTRPLIVSGGFDRTTRLWHRDTLEQLAAITISADGAWVIATPDGRAETSAADGRTHLLSWRAGDVQLPSWVGWQRGATHGLLAVIAKGL